MIYPYCDFAKFHKSLEEMSDRLSELSEKIKQEDKKMRTIKFRGISKETNQFMYGAYGYSSWSKSHYIHVETGNGNEKVYEVYPETVGQYTGFNDINGKEVYEGDRLRSGGGYFYTVLFSHDRILITQDHGKYNNDSYQFNLHSLVDYACVIVGTIHDNKYPKLNPEAEHRLRVSLNSITYQRDNLSEIVNDFHIKKLEGINNDLENVAVKIDEVLKGK